MNFSSDNIWGASPRILSAMAAAGEGTAASYGGDDPTRVLTERLSALFEREVEVFVVATGTAANALALAGMTPPWGAILAHEEAHIATDECGAPEFFANGAKLVGIPGVHGKLVPGRVLLDLDPALRRPPHTVVPSALSITQTTECGTIYSVAEVAALSDAAHRHGLGVQMDGARFANAVARLGCTPAEITWKAGVDVLAFGGTKNGCVAAEAVVVFDPAHADHLGVRRKRAGHLLSKHRFFSAQMIAMVEDGHWLELAQAANRAADRLAAGLRARGVDIAFSVDANLVFPIFETARADHLRELGAKFYSWPTRSLGRDLPAGHGVYRMVSSFATREEHVDAFLDLLDRA
jgi:threonine aldolase